MVTRYSSPTIATLSTELRAMRRGQGIYDILLPARLGSIARTVFRVTPADSITTVRRKVIGGLEKAMTSLTPHERAVLSATFNMAAAIIAESTLSYLGYGVQAPEFQWDDFKGLDVKGKTLVVLVNDPPVAEAGNPDALDPTTSGANAASAVQAPRSSGCST